MTKQELSEPLQKLIEMMQAINFGHITGLAVTAGQPDFSQPYRTIRSVKMTGGENGPRSESLSPDFELRKEHLALMDLIAGLPDGTCLTIDVRHGLPFMIEIEQKHAA